VTKQLRSEITASHPQLLSHLTTSLALSNHLTPIRTSLASLSTSLDRLARRAARFVLVARRLETQMERVKAASSGTKDAKSIKDGKDSKADMSGEGEKERELAKAALSVAELGASSLRDVAVRGRVY